MKTYWDYSDKERSELTSEQVTALLDVELMTAGVLKPVAPVLEEVPSNPVGPRQKFYGIEAVGKYGSSAHIGIVFSTIEDAEKFIALSPCIREYDYEVGTEFTYVTRLSDAKIAVEDLYSITQINEFRSALKRRKSASESNTKISSQFKAASEKADKITQGVWDDWHQHRSFSDEMHRVVSTFKEYLSLTKGDPNLALTFLEKALTRDTVNQAREWFPGEIPDTHSIAVEAAA